jgi:hypothetical protein
MAQATSAPFPNPKLQRSPKLQIQKPIGAPLLRHVFWGLVFELGTSPELGVWLLFRDGCRFLTLAVAAAVF